jgi:hypothetical protein
MTTSDTKSETANGTPIFGNASTRPNSPERKLDDKAAALETELVECKARFNKERFVYIYAIIVLVDALIGYSAPPQVFTLLIVASLIISIGLEKWLEFPWVVENLGRWLSILEKRISGAKKDEMEPAEPAPSNVASNPSIAEKPDAQEQQT